MKKILLICFVFPIVGFSIIHLPVYGSGGYHSKLEKQPFNSVFTSDTAENIIQFYKNPFTIDAVNNYHGIQFYLNGIIFLMHTRENHNGLADYISFGRNDTYYAPLKINLTKKYEYFSNRFPFPYSPGALSFTGDFRTMYFTKSVLYNGERKSQIFRAVKINSAKEKKAGWSKEFKILTFCNEKYSYMHPAVSPDGQILIFSSDMPSENEGTNLFIVTHRSSVWASPKYMGHQINSNKNEIYPFLDTHSNLFFSSDKDGGYGGYDIYMSRYNGEGWDEPINLGEKVNSKHDELMFKISRDDTLAVFVSIHERKNAKTHFLTVHIPDRMKTKTMLKTATETEKRPINKKATETKSEPAKPDNAVNMVEENVKTPAKQFEKNIPVKKNSVPVTEKAAPDIVFRVQFLSSTKPKGKFVVTINNKKYTAFEYFYKGAYRYTIGEFDTVKNALAFNTLCRNTGYKQAFVAAFKNNTRITDPEVFRH